MNEWVLYLTFIGVFIAFAYQLDTRKRIEQRLENIENKIDQILLANDETKQNDIAIIKQSTLKIKSDVSWISHHTGTNAARAEQAVKDEAYVQGIVDELTNLGKK